MAKTIAELAGTCDVFNERLETARRDIAELWKTVEAAAGELTGGGLAVAKEQVVHLRVALDELRRATDELARLQTAHREEFVVLRSQFQEHVKRVDNWDSRRWTLIGLFVASLLSLVANLIVIALRTTPK